MATPSCTVNGFTYCADVLPPSVELSVVCDRVLLDYRQQIGADLNLIHAWHRFPEEQKALLGHDACAVADWAYEQFLRPIYQWDEACLGDLIKGGLHTIARCSADGNTPLLHAAALNNVPAAEALMASGANPNDANNQGGTGLHIAAEFGHVDMTFALLRRDADLNFRDARGWTPLHRAVDSRRCCLKTVAALVEFGANLRLRNQDGDTVRDLARSNPATTCDADLLSYLTPEVDGFSM
jgi:hypothetical protein